MKTNHEGAKKGDAIVERMHKEKKNMIRSWAWGTRTVQKGRGIRREINKYRGLLGGRKTSPSGGRKDVKRFGWVSPQKRKDRGCSPEDTSNRNTL